ncbi:MAG: hypothetical protein IRZ16_07430 [Myxococcaceae bacterium]|nr:hypothetical protein [Myxococcaceae bacterium]
MRLSRALIAFDAVCLLLLGWLYGTDVADWVRARTAPVSALTELPRLWFAVPVLALTGALAVVIALAVWRNRDATYRGYRLPPILVAVVLFVDVLVLGAQRIPISSADQSAMALHLAARLLSDRVGPEGVPLDANAVGEILRGMGAPPFLVRGRRPDHFVAQVRTGCDAPVGEAPGLEAGTIIYCASRDRRVAWLTLVGLAAERRFGDPEIFTRDGLVQTTVVEAPPPPEASAADSPASPDGAPREDGQDR